jgi:5-methylcytosine-specific restriction enzyme A
MTLKGYKRSYDPRSPTASEYRKWYWTARWKRIRQTQLAKEPLCRMCKALGQTTAANVCDHLERHGGNPEKFWSGPFQSLCTRCHNVFKQREEHGQQTEIIDPLTGMPIVSVA